MGYPLLITGTNNRQCDKWKTDLQQRVSQTHFKTEVLKIANRLST